MRVVSCSFKELPPSLDGVGNKLIPAWLDNVLTQGGSVRPYLDARMPQFGKENVGHLPAVLGVCLLLVSSRILS